MINNESDFYFRELVDRYFDPVLKKSLQSLPTVEFQLINLINSMVPDSSTIHKMLTLCSNTIGSLTNGRKPYLFVTTDLKDGLLELFDITEAKLYYQLRRLKEDIVYEYTLDQISELKRKSLEAKKNNTGYHPHIDLLTELLETHFNLIKATVSPINIEKLLKPKPVKNKSLTFGYKGLDKEKLRILCSTLTVKVRLINEAHCQIDDFVEVLISKELTKTQKHIRFDCENPQLRYIIDRLMPYFSSLTFANIEKSKLFYTKKGSLLTATNLSRNKQDFPKDYKIIDQIFKQLQ